MPEVTIQKVKDPANQPMPIFADIAKRFDVVRQRAHELFETRGKAAGFAFSRRRRRRPIIATCSPPRQQDCGSSQRVSAGD